MNSNELNEKAHNPPVEIKNENDREQIPPIENENNGKL